MSKLLSRRIDLTTDPHENVHYPQIGLQNFRDLFDNDANLDFWKGMPCYEVFFSTSQNALTQLRLDHAMGNPCRLYCSLVKRHWK